MSVNNRMFLVMIGVCAVAAGTARSAELVLAQNGRSDYRIVVAEDASPSTRHGANELQKYLKQMTGAVLPIASDQAPLESHEIVLGNNAHLEKIRVEIEFTSLGREGYVIRTVGNHLVIAGGDLRGNMYGVYGLLEDHLGCRWFTPSVSRNTKSPWWTRSGMSKISAIAVMFAP